MEYFVLSNGIKIPKVGMGTNTFGKAGNDFHGEINMDTKELLWAYENGYRLVDTAIAYRNEAVIGKSIKESGLNREEIFVTSKIPMRDENVGTDLLIEKSIQTSIEKVGDYIDLYLIHHPGENEKNLQVWQHLERSYEKGLFKAIGVSNFNEEQLTYLMENAKIKPMVNQIESNPAKFNHELIKFCLKNQILPEAWGPLDPVPNKEVLEKIGLKYGKSWAQVLLRYQIERGVLVIPKSHNKERQKQNLEIFDFALDDADIEEIEG